jgi:hypothetical protein
VAGRPPSSWPPKAPLKAVLCRCPVIAMHLPAKAGGAGEAVPTRDILGPAALLRPSDYAEQPRALEPLTREDIERRDSTRDNPLLGISSVRGSPLERTAGWTTQDVVMQHRARPRRLRLVRLDGDPGVPYSPAVHNWRIRRFVPRSRTVLAADPPRCSARWCRLPRRRRGVGSGCPSSDAMVAARSARSWTPSSMRRSMMNASGSESRIQKAVAGPSGQSTRQRLSRRVR